MGKIKFLVKVLKMFGNLKNKHEKHYKKVNKFWITLFLFSLIMTCGMSGILAYICYKKGYEKADRENKPYKDYYNRKSSVNEKVTKEDLFGNYGARPIY